MKEVGRLLLELFFLLDAKITNRGSIHQLLSVELKKRLQICLNFMDFEFDKQYFLTKFLSLVDTA
jgi:hypothetical protein